MPITYVSPKIRELQILIHNNQCNNFALSQSSLSTKVDSRHVINNFKFFRNDRAPRDCGVAIYVRDYLECNIINTSKLDIEQYFLSVKINNYF